MRGLGASLVAFVDKGHAGSCRGRRPGRGLAGNLRLWAFRFRVSGFRVETVSTFRDRV